MPDASSREKCQWTRLAMSWRHTEVGRTRMLRMSRDGVVKPLDSLRDITGKRKIESTFVVIPIFDIRRGHQLPSV
jgi:hypothetical protein